MKKLFILMLFFVLPILAIQSKTLFAETKKVLVLHIIEENWDDLEFVLPKYFASGKEDRKITKKEAIKKINDLKLQLKDSQLRKEKKERMQQFLLEEVSEGNLSKDIKVQVHHNIKYYGSSYNLKENDTFIEDSLRFKSSEFAYSYNKIPEQISILLGPRVFWPDHKSYSAPIWNYFKEIRLVEDLNILSCDENGNLKIKYDDKEIFLNSNSIIELPVKERDLTKEEMMKYREKYYEFYNKNYSYSWFGNIERYFESSTRLISSSKNIFHFRTQITLVNYGFVELK